MTTALLSPLFVSLSNDKIITFFWPLFKWIYLFVFVRKLPKCWLEQTKEAQEHVEHKAKMKDFGDTWVGEMSSRHEEVATAEVTANQGPKSFAKETDVHVSKS